MSRDAFHLGLQGGTPSVPMLNQRLKEAEPMYHSSLYGPHKARELDLNPKQMDKNKTIFLTRSQNKAERIFSRQITLWSKDMATFCSTPWYLDFDQSYALGRDTFITDPCMVPCFYLFISFESCSKQLRDCHTQCKM